MAGRGRAMTMPAWMKNQDLAASAGRPGVDTDAGRGAQHATQNPMPQQAQQQAQRPFQGAPHHHNAPQGHVGYAQPYVQRAPYQHHQASIQQAPPPRQAYDSWTEATTPDGKVYYFNAVTKETTYDKPRSLMSEVERRLPTSDWREYSQGGKPYFYNSKTQTSVWQEPMEFTRYKEKLRGLCMGEAPTKDMDSLALFKAARQALDECLVGICNDNGEDKAVKKANKVMSGRELNFALVSGNLKGPPRNHPKGSEADCLNAFKELLKERRVPPGASWNFAIQHGIANDERFFWLPTQSLRTQALDEYTDWAKDQTRNALRGAGP
jgi:hypothetical protein